MRYAFEKTVARLANSPFWIAIIVVLFGVSAGAFELFVHTAMVQTATSVLGQSVLDAAIVAVAASFAPLLFLLAARERHRKVADDLRKVAALNHHIRNALQGIVYNEYLPRSTEHKNEVLAGVDRIDSILQELFPVVGDRSGDTGWKVVRINGTRAFIPPDRRRNR